MKTQPETSRLAAERQFGGSRHQRWHAAYLGGSYGRAVERGIARFGRAPAVVLKTDLWNECLGPPRDVLGQLATHSGISLFGLDLSHPVCVEARSRVPGARCVQADIRRLPFRSGSVDLLLDLSTLDHIPEGTAGAAIAEYRRVLADDGVLVIVFWQANIAVRLRLLLKRLTGRAEESSQYYFRRDAIKTLVGEGLATAEEFAPGALLLAPFGATSLVLGLLPEKWLDRLLEWVIRLEYSPAVRPLLQHFAGLHGLIATKRPHCTESRAARTPLGDSRHSRGIRQDCPGSDPGSGRGERTRPIGGWCTGKLTRGFLLGRLLVAPAANQFQLAIELERPTTPIRAPD